MAKVLKTADREILARADRGAGDHADLWSEPPGRHDLRARYVINGQSVGMDAADHYFRIDYALLAGWQATSVTETSGLRYSLAPCAAPVAADGR